MLIFIIIFRNSSSRGTFGKVSIAAARGGIERNGVQLSSEHNEVTVINDGVAYFKSVYTDLDELHRSNDTRGARVWLLMFWGQGEGQTTLLDPLANNPNSTSLLGILIKLIRRGVDVRIITSGDAAVGWGAGFSFCRAINTACGMTCCLLDNRNSYFPRGYNTQVGLHPHTYQTDIVADPDSGLNSMARP